MPRRGDLLALALEQRSHSLDVLQADRSGVVDKDRERTELALDPRDRGIDPRAVRDVDLDRDPGPDRIDRPLCGRERDVENGDECAVRRQTMADRLTDACAAAGDGGDRSFEVHEICPLAARPCV